ncbi:MAG: hypothetical protein KC415_09655, partial [Anaerolineales bacterium]|nr:hypothetical protein [Anaerolineales bacterium]
MCKTVLIGLILLFAVVGCATSPTAVPTPTTTPAVLADCFQSATAVAWLDDNGNGVWDEGERPLPGVQFALSPVAQDGTATSGEDGVAEIFAWAPGECMAITITAVAFPGYILTTPKILDYVAANTDYAFGFQPASASALVETETYIGAIFTADATAEFIAWLDEPADGFWTPTAEDAASFENELAAFLQESGDD